MHRSHPQTVVLFLAVHMILLASRAWTQQEPAIRPGEGLPVVSWQEAGDFVGQNAIVYGKIVRVGGTSNIQFLNFSEADRTAFVAVVFSRSWSNFPEPLKRMYQDQLVEVQGTITRFQGNPQMVVTHPQQIRVVNKLPETHIPKRIRRVPGDEITLASYNVLNLFDAFDDPYTSDEATPEKTRAELELLARSIRDLDADVLALQEIENRGYLQRFVDVFLPDMGYEHVAHLEGNDLRGIDVALLSRIPLGRIVSYAALRFAPAIQQDGTSHFQRDLLCVELLPPGRETFQVWVVHLKSKAGEESELTEPIRMSEARQIRQIVDATLAADPQARFLICGDFNDTVNSKPLRTILGPVEPRLRTLFQSVPAEDRVTYNQEPHRSMIDFIVCSPAMAERFVEGSYRIVPGSVTTTGSDHNAVSCRFRLRSAALQGPSPPNVPALPELSAERVGREPETQKSTRLVTQAVGEGMPEETSPGLQSAGPSMAEQITESSQWWLAVATGLIGLAAGYVLSRRWGAVG